MSRPPASHRRVTALLALCAATAASGTSLASPTFPSAIQSYLELSEAPDCTLCHDGDPGIGTATSAFATAMRQRGLVANDTGSLTTAIDALDGEQTDSDSDGFGDIEELRLGWDPNLANNSDGSVVAGATRTKVLDVSYGCSATAARPRLDGVAALSVALSLCCLLVTRRSRRHAPSP